MNYPPDGSDYQYLLELRAEAEYYGLPELLEQIDKHPVSHFAAMSEYGTSDGVLKHFLQSAINDVNMLGSRDSSCRTLTACLP